MNYVTIVNLVFSIISTLVSLYLLHFPIFMIVGAIHRKRFPKTGEKCRYGILVSAKDEENVISRLINSLRNADYPQEKLDLFIIAHNCKDKTADVARSLGANVIVYNDVKSRTLGSAYQYAFRQINVKDYDGFVVLNADNEVRKDYFEKLNDAFVHHGKNSSVTTFRYASNIEDGVMPALYGYYFAASCLSYAGRECLAVSCRVTGCGFVVPTHLLEDGWKYTSITEDIEFSADKVLDDKKIHYCDEAIFYDEQPRDFKTMWFQRLRWAKGQSLISRKYFGRFLKALFGKTKKNKFSIYVMLTFVSFIPLLFFFLFLLQNILLLFSPLAGVSLQEAFLYWDTGQNWFGNLYLSLNTGALFGMAKSFAWFFVASYLTAIVILISSRGKFKQEAKLPMIGGFLLFPFFLLLQVPLDMASLFIRDLKWRKIPHGASKKK